MQGAGGGQSTSSESERPGWNCVATLYFKPQLPHLSSGDIVIPTSWGFCEN